VSGASSGPTEFHIRPLVDLARGAADERRDGGDGQGNGRCSETLRERDDAFSQALLSKLFVLEAEIAHGQRAAAGLAARLDERHRCRVGRRVDRLLWNAFRGRFSTAGSFHC
jgi:hypothetical protein